ncbi:Crotonobetainyl-CoA:carnitine CoA-transferase CaiB [Parafrankia irregularis]|uniref:Crotonobetainyl-CoA:carnitine CoA-transferase CaiB n=1 Tax=Parafrankia irregularis TaxID=795642 RepID=A0A0S4QTR8_9ACTN|nr:MULTISPECIES: CaiB/BaiF CoA-transferase family protein [Parafrankia]MBE3202666.1 CoA transferase [Parafrankia sp. CH37]CUU57850.1 Crotonobetainyl-CoA:carnitine CoA-transferase CaiB [Parafrankia irregularis]
MLLPLQGVRVLDLSRTFPGAWCTRLLSDLGAEVIRVEAPGVGDMLRGPTGSTSAHVGLNRGKRSVTLDTRSGSGIEVLRRLVVTADAVVDSAPPAARAAAGFGYPQAAELNPRLVWVGLSAFGLDGPYAGRAGHEITFLGHSGALTAIAGQLPWMPQTPIAAPLAGAVASAALSAALVAAARTGSGSLFDVSIDDVATWLLAATPGRFSGIDSDAGWAAGRRLYRCADDRWVTVAAAEARTWHALCRVLDADDLVDRLWADEDEQVTMAERFEKVFATRPAADWVAVGSKATIGPVNDGVQLVDDPHVSARGTLVDIAGTLVPAAPFRLGAAGELQPAPPTGLPTLGEDTDDILRAAGVSDEELAQLRATGTI